MNILGVNGGLSKELSVHPSVDPSRKFDGSFISLNKIIEYREQRN